MNQYLENLNPEQRDAILSEGHILITACPGSGKTRVLAHKLALEITRLNATKKKFVALTYTNRAADEIRRRTMQFDIEPENLWTGTIHSFCLEWILKPYMGYCREVKFGFEIVDEWDAERLLGDLKREYGYSVYENVKKTYNLDGSFQATNPKHIELLNKYKATLQSAKLIDFDDILFLSYKLIKAYPTIAIRLSNIFPLICVDEYQDTQELQYAILAEIIKARGNQTKIFFVGDISQAIYGSLGGVAKNATQISSQFGCIDVQQKSLSGNYRSNQRLIDYYSNYQLTNFQISSKADHAGHQGHITFNSTIHRDDVHAYVAKIIRKYTGAGIPPHEICVLAPQWHFIIPMGRKLKKELPNIDFDAFGLSPFKKVRENIGYKLARLFLSEPGNGNYFQRSIWTNELLNDLDHLIPHFLSEVDNRKRVVLRTIRAFHPSTEDSIEYLQSAIEYFFSSLQITLTGYPDLSERLKSFHHNVGTELSKSDFDYANDLKVLRRLFNTNNGVVINTCHGVKGEEFEVVIAFGLLHGYLPHAQEDDAQAAKKLLYVICSRAKNYLHLISEKGYSKRGIEYNPTSDLGQVSFNYDSPISH